MRHEVVQYIYNYIYVPSTSKHEESVGGLTKQVTRLERGRGLESRTHTYPDICHACRHERIVIAMCTAWRQMLTSGLCRLCRGAPRRSMHFTHYTKTNEPSSHTVHREVYMHLVLAITRTLLTVLPSNTPPEGTRARSNVHTGRQLPCFIQENRRVVLCLACRQMPSAGVCRVYRAAPTVRSMHSTPPKNPNATRSHTVQEQVYMCPALPNPRPPGDCITKQSCVFHCYR